MISRRSPSFAATFPRCFQLEEEIKVRSPQVAAAGASAVFQQVRALIPAIFSGRQLDGEVLESKGVKQSVRLRPGDRDADHGGALLDLQAAWSQRRPGNGRGVQSTGAGVSVFSLPRMLTIARELGYSNKDGESLDMFRLTADAFPGLIVGAARGGGSADRCRPQGRGATAGAEGASARPQESVRARIARKVE